MKFATNILSMHNFILHKYAIISWKISTTRDYLSKYELFSQLIFLKRTIFFLPDKYDIPLKVCKFVSKKLAKYKNFEHKNIKV